MMDITGSVSQKLKGKRIVLGVTGSVAIVKSVELARELMRNGADITAVMSSSAQKLVKPALLEWATGNPVVTELTGKTEHILYCGKHMGKADLLLIAPCTGNTLSKIAHGYDDTTVTTFAATALGSGVPVILVPAMHESMYDHRIISENLELIKSAGIRIIDPELKENKAKIASVQQIVQAVVTELTKKSLKGKKVLITAGPTVEYIDPVRVITNMSSGKMGVELAREAKSRGAEVTMVYGPGSERPYGDRIIRIMTTEEMQKAVEKELKSEKYDIVVMAAAPADYTPDRQENDKISTKNLECTIRLKSTPKITKAIRKLAPETFFIGFKAEFRKDKKELVRRGKAKMDSDSMDLVVVNDVGKEGSGFRVSTNSGYILGKNGNVTEVRKCSKREFAARILDRIDN